MSGGCAPACVALGNTRKAALELNSTCPCWPIDPEALRRSLSPAVRATLGEPHQHLFATTGVFLHATDLAAMQAQVRAIESVAQLAGYEATTGATAIQAGTRGALMGYDFHLTAAGPRLIEINTNAGGAFLVHKLYAALQLPSIAGANSGSKLSDMLRNEWLQAGRVGAPRTIAIVDDDPEAQYLFGDMQAAAELLRRQFNQVIVLGAEDLIWTGTGLSANSLGGETIDLVYNRHTDFALTGPTVKPLRAAYDADRVVLTPAPRHHALLASKRNLQTLGDAAQLRQWGASADDVQVLAAIPQTSVVSADNADALWRKRRELFFKPVAGFGGRAAYRGAKLTKRVWGDIVRAPAGDYVAQEYVPAAVRRMPGEVFQSLKYDLRLYTYAGECLGMVARLYQGQTTNFRTPGGGFAPVAVLANGS